jgi:flagellar protein FlaG
MPGQKPAGDFRSNQREDAMEVNSNPVIKSHPPPAAGVVQQEGGSKAEPRRVEQGDAAARAALDEQKLKEREQQSKRLSSEELAAVVSEIQERLDAMGTKLNFSLDDKTESIVIQIKNQKSGELVRQIPTEEMLALKAKLEDLIGVLFDRKV